jgi:hypothetical protein
MHSASQGWAENAGSAQHAARSTQHGPSFTLNPSLSTLHPSPFTSPHLTSPHPSLHFTPSSPHSAQPLPIPPPSLRWCQIPDFLPPPLRLRGSPSPSGRSSQSVNLSLTLRANSSPQRKSMPHHAARRVPLILQSSLTKSFTYRTSTRNFHASTANMAIKTYVLSSMRCLFDADLQ